MSRYGPSPRERLELPLVHAVFDRQTLAEALQVIADWTGYSVVLDERVGDKAGSPVTATFPNAAPDTAVHLLADMSGLKLVVVDKVLYVTSLENAKVLQKEDEDRRKQMRYAVDTQ